jgi:hypothetical protein
VRVGLLAVADSSYTRISTIVLSLRRSNKSCGRAFLSLSLLVVVGTVLKEKGTKSAIRQQEQSLVLHGETRKAA